jgi:ADP-ribosyl-[dinitrogen reductase] hydrolase
LRKELDGMLEGRRPAGANDTHDVISVLYRALAAFNTSKNFTSGMLIAAGASAAAAVGALYGSLAGAHYGVDGIPESWRRALQQRQQLSALARRFA